MKIDDNLSPSGTSPASDLRSQGVAGASEARAPGRAEPGKTNGATDSASLSALGLELSRALENEPPERVEKIGRLQEAVTSGTYTVPSSAVSASIVASLLKGG